MKKSKHRDEQVVTALKKTEAGLSIRELARQMKVSGGGHFPRVR